MQTDPDIHTRIVDVVERISNVDIEEIRAIFRTLGGVESSYDDGTLFRIAGRRLVIQHLDGKLGRVSHHSIREFRDLMIDLDLIT